MENKIREFIENNEVYFEEGSRNSSVIVLIGYSQFLELSKENLENTLVDEINADDEIQEEIDRLWNYCASNNYKKYWKTAQAKKDWQF
jgi:hypothetical protein